MLEIKSSTKEPYTQLPNMHVRLSDGRMKSLEDVIIGYERLLKENRDYERRLEKKPSKKVTTSELRGDKWFVIDRYVIDKSKEEIHRKCNEAGAKGEALWKDFVAANKIADENYDQYPRLIETYTFRHNGENKTEQEMRDVCEETGDGMRDEVIRYLELQMRICNGESVDDLIKKADQLPCTRLIKTYVVRRAIS